MIAMSDLVKMKKAPEWAGYDFDQIIYERAVLLARIEVEKERLAFEGDRLRHGNVAMSRSFFTRLMGLVSYADFIVLGVKIWRIISPVFRKKK